ncbi:MAG: endonuclease III [Methanobacteriaceae archaeon]|jgi:endonuclease-3|uniref:endonuclease III domain-containing protein n=1 Tax=Methanobrevibacter TaxID=2172 RepID=UPI002A0DB392|nr:endonuclease III [Methanobacteriaceae archaeon]MDD3408904.1 endonuclease III [Methanobacteriaceae archaeon]MDD4594653.1 endonuclease III [Methanobacteriaceae archaeon]
MDKTEQVIEIFKRLKEIYTIRIFEGKDPYKVLIRTILSQRTRDENTDQATANLFNKYPDINSVANAPVEDIEELVHPAGFYHVKAARIQEVSQIIIDEYDGVVPDNMKELLDLPGVGRKTANCVLVFAFCKPAIPVDTHVHRISNRWGLVDTSKPEQTELELMKIVPKDMWIELNDIMVQFGQTICKPTSPQCGDCPLIGLCAFDNG